MPWFVVLGLFVASYVLSGLLMKKNRIKPASLEEFEFPQADEGTPQPVVFGDVWQSGWFVPWYGRLRTKKIKSGGKK